MLKAVNLPLILINSMSRTQRPKIGITTLEDISALILQSHDLDETLRNIVTLVARRMRSDVCSIYLLDADNVTLRLQASKGLSRKAIGKVTLQIGEGLTGMAAQKRHATAPANVEEANDDRQQEGHKP